MDEEPVLRVFSFQPQGTESAVDETFRVTMLPDLLALPGLADTFVGRRAEDAGERVLTTVWDSRHEMEAAADEALILSRLHPEERPALLVARVEVGRLAFGVRPERREPPRILRVVRGTVRSGELEAYIDEAQAGTIADARTNDGLIALYVGITGRVTFTTVSAWTGWEAIETATGGDIRRPLATKHSERLVSFDGAHYEIVPNIDRPRRRVPAVA